MKKISELTELTSGSIHDNDWLEIIDAGDITMSSNGTNKKVKVSSLAAKMAAAGATGAVGATGATGGKGDPGTPGSTGMPTGMVMPFAGLTAPTGWLACNGQTIANSGDTADLYALLGTTYGTAGKVPDLRGYFVRGAGTNSDSTVPASANQGVKQVAYAGYNKFEIWKDDGDDVTGPRGEVNAIKINDIDLTIGTDKAPGTSSYQAENIATIPGDTRPYNIALLYVIKK